MKDGFEEGATVLVTDGDDGRCCGAALRHETGSERISLAVEVSIGAPNITGAGDRAAEFFNGERRLSGGWCERCLGPLAGLCGC